MMPLSPAEVRVLAATAGGLDNSEVGRVLGRSEQTVKNTLTNVRETLGALNTIHAVALMDDHWPGWRPRLVLPARPSDVSGRAFGFAIDPGSRGAGTS